MSYKLLVVDDEPIIRDGLASFAWDKTGFVVVGSASNGREALETMELDPADAIITDIRMPVMDGLELCRIARYRYPNCKVVLLSGYKDFDYAKTAIAEGVCDYLLKPVDLKELEELFHKLGRRISAERETQRLAEDYRNRLAYSLPLAQSEFLRSLIDGKMPDLDSVEERLNLLELWFDREYFACVVIKPRFDQFASALEGLRAMLDSSQLGYLVEVSEEEAVAVLNFSLPPSATDPHEKLGRLASELQAALSGHTRQEAGDLLMGVGDAFRSVMLLSLSCSQAHSVLQRSFFEQQRGIFYAWEDAGHYSSDEIEYPYQVENDLMNTMLDGDQVRARELLDRFWESLPRTASQHDSELLRSMVIKLLNMIERQLNRHQTSLSTLTGISPPLSQFVQLFRTFNELRSSVNAAVIKITEHLSLLNQNIRSTSHAAIRAALDFVKTHHSEPITLSDVAEAAHLNPSYLSVLFRKETGKKYVDFLRALRMEKAREMLVDSPLKISEIAGKVGYLDTRYFANSFKAYAGLSPGEYRRRACSS